MQAKKQWARLALIVLLAGLIAGCESDQPQMTRRPEMARPTMETPPPPPPRPVSPPPAPMRRSAPRMDSPAGSAVTIAKSAPRTVLVGQEFDYIIELRNIAGAAVEDVVLTEKLPGGLKLISTKPKADMAGNTVTWRVGTMAAGATERLTIRAQATQTGELVGCSDIAYKIPQVCVALTAVQPALEIAKSGPGEVLACDPIPMKVVVRNTGTGNATNVKVSDEFPDGLMLEDGRKSVSVDIGTLAPGQAREVTLRTKAAGAGRYVNRATATADNGLSAQSGAVTVVVRKPVLKVAKSAPAMRYVGRPATYTITVTNTGDGEARDTVLTDTLAAGAEFVRADGGGRMSGGKVTWPLGTLKPNESKKVSVTVNATRKGELRNTAVAKAYCAEASDEAVIAVKGIPAILLECVDHADPIELGANETYTITVTNQGSADDTNIVIKCTLPDAQEYVSGDGPAKATKEGKDVTFAALKSLAPKAKATYRVVVKGVRTGDIRFKVRLTSDQLTSPVTETESTHIYGE